MTTVTISEALKNYLVEERDEQELGSLNETILYILRNPNLGERSLAGYDDTLTEPVKVTQFTLGMLQSIRDSEGYDDYEDVIRGRAGIEERDVGEKPVDIRPL